jgi:hypothetical protein
MIIIIPFKMGILGINTIERLLFIKSVFQLQVIFHII